jgi:hypothetical protein
MCFPEMWGMMSNNYRIYGTIFLLVEVLIVAMGVRFVQLFAPVNECFIGKPWFEPFQDPKFRP